MRTRAYAVALLVAFAPIAVPVAPVFAQDAMTEMARQRFQDGVKAFDKGKFEEARAQFLQAYALKRHPAVLLNLAQSELKSNHPVDAAKHFAQYLRENTSATALEKADAEKGLADARAKCGHVAVNVNAAGADVFVDGELAGRSPLADSVDVGAGNHTVEAKLNGHSASKTVGATIGKTVAVDLAIDGVSGAPIIAPLPGPGTSPAPSSPGALPPPTGAPSGLDSAPGAPAPNPDIMQMSTSGREPLVPWFVHTKAAWATAGLTVVGLGLGIGMSAAASSAGSKADDIAGQIKARWNTDPEAQKARPGGNVCASPAVNTLASNYANGANYAGPCGSLQDNLDQQDSDKKIALLGFVAAGVGAVGTAGLYFLTSKKPADAAASPTAAAPVLAPIVAPHTAGLVLGGAF